MGLSILILFIILPSLVQRVSHIVSENYPVIGSLYSALLFSCVMITARFISWFVPSDTPLRMDAPRSRSPVTISFINRKDDQPLIARPYEET